MDSQAQRPNTIALDARFWAKVRRGAGDACWEWTGATSDFGHGVVRSGGVLYRAHRLVWEVSRGPIPDGLCALHRCDNPRCVRIDHLFLGTKRDNTEDMMAKGRHAPGGARGEQLAQKLTEADVREIRARYRTAGGAIGKGHRGGIRQADLARTYGVSQVLIGNIVRGKVWRHLS